MVQMMGQCCSLNCKEEQEVLKKKCIFATKEYPIVTNLKYIICFTGNSDAFISSLVYHFAEDLTSAAESETVVLCEPLEYLAEKLTTAINNGQICDMNSLASKAGEMLNVKLKLLQENLKIVAKNAKYLLINGLLNAEEIIMIQEKFGIEPIIVEIFDSNRFRNINQIPRKSIRSSLRLNINSKNDVFTLRQSMMDYLFNALKIDKDYKDIPPQQRSYTVSEFGRLQVASTLLFHRAFKKIYVNGSSIYLPKSPLELEDSINPEPVEGGNNNDYFKSH